MQQLQNVSEWDQEENCDVSYTAIKMSPSVLLTGCTKSYGGLNYNEVITICFDHSPYWPRLTDQGRQLLLLLISNSRMEKHFCKCQSGIIESLWRLYVGVCICVAQVQTLLSQIPTILDVQVCMWIVCAFKVHILCVENRNMIFFVHFSFVHMFLCLCNCPEFIYSQRIIEENNLVSPS